MKKITLNFETDELYEAFTSWFCNGDGEDDFYSNIEYSDTPAFYIHTYFDHGKVKEINFKETNNE